ncbi:MAG: hypothetical protein E7164_00540 [Firmicutes bacterium]|nr:hypothetical protein [Bacillota bacterium]
MSRKRKITLSAITLLLIICTAISASYAFYTFTVGTPLELSTTADIPDCIALSMTGAGINLSGDSAAPISDVKALSSTNYRYSFTVSNACGEASNLKIALAPVNGSTMPNRALKYVLIEQSASVPTQGLYLTNNPEKMFTKQIISDAKKGYEVDIETGYELLNTSIDAGSTKSYYLYLWVDYYEGDKNQSGDLNNSTMNTIFDARLIVSDYSAAEGGTVTLANAVLAKESSSDYTSSQDGSIYRVVDQNGVRYEGKDPDNYVWYNCTDDNDTSTCERWRIIGVFNGADVGLDSSKKYTKIARSTPLETLMVWDTGGENDWVNSTLNAYLNGEYLSSLSTTAQTMIATYNNKYSLWHLRGPDSTTYEYAAGWYEIEKNTGTPGYRNGTAGAADAAKEYAIGLMYPSDYGYAAYGTACNNESTETLYNYGGSCAAVDWLLYSEGNEWLISPYAGRSDYAFFVYVDYGRYVDYVSVYNEFAARPVLYLEADVLVKDGNGSEENPYKLHYEAPPKEYLSDYVLALESSDDYTSKADGTIYRVVNQNGVRYEGKNPDNYVWYNCTDDNDTTTCERWRIIGVFDGADIGLEAGKNYTKIARSTPIANMAWDSTSPHEHDWVNSTLYQYLNGTYLTSILSAGAREKIAKYNNQYSTWHLLGPTSSEFENYYTPDMYQAERDITIGHKGYRNGVAGAADVAKEAAIGLMYPSDYGYAAYGSTCNNESTEPLNNYNTCAAVDWLMYYNPDEGYYYEWLISPVTGTSNLASGVFGGYGGHVGFTFVDAENLAVRPVLYLEASVEKKEGQGTYDLPYELG